jgi:hypothetical protein
VSRIPTTWLLCAAGVAGLACTAGCGGSGGSGSSGGGQASASVSSGSQPPGAGASSATAPGRSAAEALAGTLNSPPGTAPVVTFKATGLFSATGTVTLKRCSLSNHYRCIADPDLALGPDVLHLKYGRSMFTQFQEASSCNGSYANRMPYTITGGTGAYAGASGHGAAEIEFVGTFQKVNGKCDFGGQAKPITGSARLSYGAHGPVTLPPAASASSGA